MARVELLDPNEYGDPSVREFASKITKPDGSVPAHFAAETHFPEVMMNVYDARLALARRGELGTRLFTKLAVTISMRNECVYCTGAYSTQLSQQLGGDGDVRAFHRAVRDGALRGKEAAVIDFAMACLEDPGSVTDEAFSSLREDHGFTDRTFVEVLYIVNIVSGYNRLTLALDLEYDHSFPESWAREAVESSSEAAR